MAASGHMAGHAVGHAARTPREIEAAVLSAPLPSAASRSSQPLTYLVIAAHYAADFSGGRKSATTSCASVWHVCNAHFDSS
jgi:hypothetical protein